MSKRRVNAGSGTQGEAATVGKRRERRVAEPPREAQELYFAICDRFLDPRHRNTADDVAAWATKELARRQKPHVRIHRQHIYPIVQKVISAGFVRFCPPLNYGISRRIADISGAPEESITVVDVDEESAEHSEHIESVAADRCYRLIEQVVSFKQREEDKEEVTVHLGLGAGRTSMLVAKHLGRILRSSDPMPGLKGLVVHAISSGYLAGEPETAPGATFFADLRQPNVRIRFVPLLAEPMVLCSQFSALKKRPGIKEAFAEKWDVDIVITSLAGKGNEYGMLNRLERDYMQAYPKLPKLPYRVGDVQFRPFDENGPVNEPKGGYRAVTLFEIRDFRRLITQEGKFLLLVAGPGFRGDSKVDPLSTMFNCPNLRIWSHACVDMGTGRELVRRLKPRSPSNPLSGPTGDRDPYSPDTLLS